MQLDPPNQPIPPAKELRDVYQTLTGLATPTDQLANRLQFVADLLADATTLPAAQIVTWRGPDQAVRHAVIGKMLIVGRDAGPSGVTLAEDKLLSRHHFSIQTDGKECVLQDLKSRNGTSINRTENRVGQETLRDGDLIFAGNQVFVFLDQTLTT